MTRIRIIKRAKWFGVRFQYDLAVLQFVRSVRDAQFNASALEWRMPNARLACVRQFLASNRQHTVEESDEPASASCPGTMLPASTRFVFPRLDAQLVQLSEDAWIVVKQLGGGVGLDTVEFGRLWALQPAHVRTEAGCSAASVDYGSSPPRLRRLMDECWTGRPNFSHASVMWVPASCHVSRNEPGFNVRGGAATVAYVSFGAATRNFKVEPSKPAGLYTQLVVVTEHDTLVVLGGRSRRDYACSVPACVNRRACGERICIVMASCESR